jgi:hypothetical protein
MQSRSHMRVTFIIGLVPAWSSEASGTPSQSPPVHLLAPRGGVGIARFGPRRHALRLHRGQPVSAGTTRAAVGSALGRWRYPALSIDVERVPFAGSTQLLLVRKPRGRPSTTSGVGVAYRVRTGRFVGVLVGFALNA